MRDGLEKKPICDHVVEVISHFRWHGNIVEHMASVSRVLDNARLCFICISTNQIHFDKRFSFFPRNNEFYKHFARFDLIQKKKTTHGYLYLIVLSLDLGMFLSFKFFLCLYEFLSYA